MNTYYYILDSCLTAPKFKKEVIQMLKELRKISIETQIDHITQSLATTHDNFASEIGSQHIMDCPYARKAVHVFQTDLPPCLIHYLYGLIESYFWISVKGPEFTKQNKMERIRYPVLFFYAIHYFITSYLKENKHFCKQIQSDSKPNNDF